MSPTPPLLGAALCLPQKQAPLFSLALGLPVSLSLSVSVFLPLFPAPSTSLLLTLFWNLRQTVAFNLIKIK